MRHVQLWRKKQFHHCGEKLWTESATRGQVAAHAVRPEMGTNTRILDLSVCVCLSPHWPGTACTHTHTHPAQDLHILSSLGCFLALLWATCTSLSGPWPPPSETTALASFSPWCLFCHTHTQNVAFLTVTWVTLALHWSPAGFAQLCLPRGLQCSPSDLQSWGVCHTAPWPPVCPRCPPQCCHLLALVWLSPAVRPFVPGSFSCPHLWPFPQAGTQGPTGPCSPNRKCTQTYGSMIISNQDFCIPLFALKKFSFPSWTFLGMHFNTAV